ncbi:MAG TPA: ABC transporter permease [Burkholderiaceae bacterium]|nr:ABC transporter permease [Burkholderiaceae bacterium]
MLTYLIRRVLYALLVLFGVNLAVFILFFAVNTPDDMARMQLGGKRVTQEAVDRWKAERGYDRPLFFNPASKGLHRIVDTVFFDNTARVVRFDFGKTAEGRDIAHEIHERAKPSFAIAIPVFIVTVGISIVFALGLAMFRGHWLDRAGVISLVALMSISSLFFIIMGQYVFSRVLALTPISGYAPPPDMFKYIVLPVIVMVLARLGPDARLYRTIYLEELGKDYVRTARAKGLGEFAVLFRHVLRNSLIPIITASGLLLPTLFVGAIVTETFFALPGLGMFTIEGITQQDFGIVRAMVFFGSVLYVAAYLLTDIAYAWADPRVRLS